jgi:hypothetical protein
MGEHGIQEHLPDSGELDELRWKARGQQLYELY